MREPRPIFVPVETALVLDANGWHLSATPPAWWLEMTSPEFDVDEQVPFLPTGKAEVGA